MAEGEMLVKGEDIGYDIYEEIMNHYKNMHNVHVKIAQKKKREYVITLDADRFERLAATFGFFGKDFLKSLTLAEKDIKKGKIEEISSLKELRKKKI